MTLTVQARRLRTEGDVEGNSFESPAPPHNELAGFESWRGTVYGSAAVKRLGLRVLPSLASGDVYASGDQLDELESEVRLLTSSLRAVVDELLADGVHIVSRPSDPHETVRCRIANIAEAVRLARGLPHGVGEVVIW